MCHWHLLRLFSHAPKAERFNNVIDDFDTYLQMEKEGKVQEQKQQLPVNTQNQGYDIFSSLSTVPAPKRSKNLRQRIKELKAKLQGIVNLLLHQRRKQM
ncbi:hypothetical protein J4731_13065 [Providencia rettgeri]|nr:hypothetical protein [Providencia rettgeri]